MHPGSSSAALLPASLAVLLAGVVCCGGPAEELPDEPAEVTLGPRDDLQAVLDTLRGPATVALESGDYRLEPVAYTDPSCGNCQDPDETVPATRGLRLQGRGIHLRGGGAGTVVLHTAAGYGVLFDGCDGCSLSGLTVTGGIRDPDGRATDAGVVVRGGRVTLEDCVIRDNLGDSAVVHTVVVGVAGVALREGSDAHIRNCRIERNSWDGIAMYRGARARITDNVVDGVDRAAGAEMGGGRGVGIGLTWDARARITGNLVTRYWKGIGVFVNARALIRENVVENVLTWGMAYWGPDGGRPVAVMENNAVFETGACGISVDRTVPFEPSAESDEGRGREPGVVLAAPDGPGRVRGNLLVRTGLDERYDSGEPYCHQRPIARHNVPEDFRIAGNLLLDVRQPGDGLPRAPTLTARAFRLEAAEILTRLAAHEPTRRSRFLGAYAPAGR